MVIEVAAWAAPVVARHHRRSEPQRPVPPPVPNGHLHVIDNIDMGD
ncbi:hypothetical protein AB0H57_17240 [Micromonospora sp. NPDC050686]